MVFILEGIPEYAAEVLIIKRRLVMMLLLDGRSEISAHMCRDLVFFIRSRHLFRKKANLIFFPE